MSNSSWPSWTSGFFSPIFSQPPPPHRPRLSKPHRKLFWLGPEASLFPWLFPFYPRPQDSIPRCEHRVSVDPLTVCTLVLPTQRDETSWKSGEGVVQVRGRVWVGATLSEGAEGPRPPPSSSEWLLPTPQGLVLGVKSVPWRRGQRVEMAHKDTPGPESRGHPAPAGTCTADHIGDVPAYDTRLWTWGAREIRSE